MFEFLWFWNLLFILTIAFSMGLALTPAFYLRVFLLIEGRFSLQLLLLPLLTSLALTSSPIRGRSETLWVFCWEWNSYLVPVASSKSTWKWAWKLSNNCSFWAEEDSMIWPFPEHPKSKFSGDAIGVQNSVIILSLSSLAEYPNYMKDEF